MRVAKGDSFVAVCDIRQGFDWPKCASKTRQGCVQKVSLELLEAGSRNYLYVNRDHQSVRIMRTLETAHPSR